ncbi:hypothetical protein [Micromonospora zhanjiangensis]
MTSVGQEVSPVKNYINERPSALAAAYGPVSAVRDLLTVDIPMVPQAHQVSAPAPAVWQLALTLTGINGTSGFTGKGVKVAGKRTEARGVPPRGRPPV